MTGVQMKRLLMFSIVIASFAIVPIAAADGSSVLDAYGTNGSKAIIQVKGATSTKAPAATTQPSATVTQSGGVTPSTLPFTGVDLVVFLVAGTALVLLGGGIRRLGRDKS